MTATIHPLIPGPRTPRATKTRKPNRRPGSVPRLTPSDVARVLGCDITAAMASMPPRTAAGIEVAFRVQRRLEAAPS